MSFRTALIDQLVSAIGISKSPSHPGSELAAPAIRAALRGETPTRVSVIDHRYAGERWIILRPLTLDDGYTAVPRIVRTHHHVCRPSEPQDGWEEAFAEGRPVPHQACTWCEQEILPRLVDLGWVGRHDQLATAEVAQWFAGRANGADWDPDLPTEAPAAADTFARVSIGGDIPDIVGTTDDENWQGNYYRWYDLATVPVGGSVYRISARRQGTEGTLWTFTRRDEDRWEVTIVPDARWATTRGRASNGQPLDAVIEGAMLALSALQHEDDEENDPIAAA